MSSEDEMNNWDHPSDARPPNPKTRARPRKKTKAGSPGPSNSTPDKPSSKRPTTTHQESDNVEDVTGSAAVKPLLKSKPRSKATTVNGQQDHKGREKAISSKTSKKQSSPEEAVEGDQTPVAENEGNAQTNLAAAGTSKNNSSSDSKVRKELERWKQKARDLEAQCDTLSKQLEELFELRKTEPEKALEQLHSQYDERVKGQDALIKELTSQISRLDPLSRTGTVVALHFLTREAADEEKRVIERDILRLQEVVRERDNTIVENTKRIADLEQQVQDAIRERDAEIERSRELLARAAPKGTPSNSRSHAKRPFGSDDPKTIEVVKFYEDMSNLLITNVKFENALDSEEPEVIFHCIYSYYEMTRRADEVEGERTDEKSIDFTMRIYNGYGGPNGERASDDDFIHRRIKYTPLHLDKEPESFVKGLGYMGESFTFPSAQQGLFLNSLRELIRDASKDPSETEVDTEEMAVEDGDT